MSWIQTAFFFHFIALSVIGVVLFVMLRKQGKNTVDWSFILLLTSFFAWVLMNSTSMLVLVFGIPPALPSHLAGLAVLSICVSVYIFCEIFPSGTVSKFGLVRIGLLLLLTLLIAPLVFTDEWISEHRVVDGVAASTKGRNFTITSLWATFVMALGLIKVVLKYRRLNDPVFRRQIRIFLTGGALNLFIAVFFSFILPVLGYDALFFLGPDSSVVLLTLLMYAMLQHRLLGIGTHTLRLILRFITSFVISALLYAVFLFFILERGLANFSWSFVLSLAMLFFFATLYAKFIQPRFEAFFFRPLPHAEEVINQLLPDKWGPGRDSLADVMDGILTSLGESIPYEKCVIVSLDRFGQIRSRNRRLLPGTPEQMDAGLAFQWQTQIQGSNILLQALNQILILDSDDCPTFSRHLRKNAKKWTALLFDRIIEDLRSKNFSLVMPLINRQELCGFVILGRRTDDIPYQHDDLRVLNALRLSCALVLRNALYFEEVEQLKSRAEKEVEQLTEFISTQDVVRRNLRDRSLVYRSKIMQNVMAGLAPAAASDYPVLITGETGTGKELIAQLIHESDERKDVPFAAVNCAAIPDALWEDEIFGHVKGAFTDASSDRKGRIAEAGGGTLFFDEIGEMPLPMQAKMLRLLQEKVYSPVGSERELKAECRFVFATNQNLETMIEEGRFRKDLFYRINVFPLHLPPLRERTEDIPVIAMHILEKLSRDLGTTGKAFDQASLAVLVKHHWPGNIRELENTLIRALSHADSEILTIADLPVSITHRKEDSTVVQKKKLVQSPVQETLEMQGNLDETLADMAIKLIRQALVQAGNNKAEAARLLGISRSKLRYKIKELGIE